MIRLVQRRLIIPRGDTGTFSIPVLKPGQTGNVAVFTIFDDATKTKVFTKEIASEGDVLNITLTHLETVNLQAGKYLWDIKYYSNPVYTDDELTDGEEVDSYYAGFTLPVCEIRETADNFLLADNAPGATLTPTQLDMISAALRNLQHGIAQVQENVEHYPYIQDNYWYIWDSESEQFVNTEVCANGIPGRTPIIQDDKWWMWDAETEEYVDSGIPVYPDISNLILAQEEQPTEEENKIWFKTGESDVLELPTYNEMVETVQNVVAYQEEQPDSDLNRIWIPTTSEQTVAIPSYEEFEEGLAAKLEAKDVAAVAISGDYADLEGAPTGVSAFTNDAGYLTAHQDLSGKQDKLTFDSAPTANSNNPVTSGGIYDAITHINTMKIHVCGTQEYDNEGIPTVANPAADTFYLVPGGEGTNLFVEWAFVDGAWERFGSADVDLSNYVQKTDYASADNAGVVKVDADKGIKVTNNTLEIVAPQNSIIKSGQGINKPVVVQQQHRAVFYGLAKAAGDSTQSVSDNAVGTYTDEAKVAIQQMLDVPSTSDIPEVPVQDVQVNGVSVLNNGVANVPIAADSRLGVSKYVAQQFAVNTTGQVSLKNISDTDYKAGSSGWGMAVRPNSINVLTFYGLAKAAHDTTQSQSSNDVGDYTDSAKAAIQSMLGVSSMLAPENPNLIASQAYSIGDVFAANGHLYKATAAIAQDEAIIPDTNCVETTMVDAGGKIKDVQVAGTSVVGSDGVANVPIATSSTVGVVRTLADRGTGINNSTGALEIVPASDSQIKNGNSAYRSASTNKQHTSVFYGLSKIAGVDLANENVTPGTYPETSKTAIKAMLGVQDGLKVVRLI